MHLYHPSSVDPADTPDSYWEATAPPMAHTFSSLEGEETCDVAIIGGGYTGLSAALRLANEYGLSVRVLEKARPGWGASGRNGGFCCMGSTKLSYETLIARYGLEETRHFATVQQAAVDHVRDFLDRRGVDAGQTGKGELCLAHKPSRVAGFRAEADMMKRTFGIEMTIYGKGELAGIGAAGPDFHGALWTPVGFGLHPLRYVRALADACAEAGVTIHSDSPVTDWGQDDGCHLLKTPRGAVRAAHVLLATNGYTDDTIPKWIGGRVLPAMTAIIVTRPLTAAERAAQGFTTEVPSFDTRILLHYFRMLPDGRFLFGGRGGTDASPDGVTARLAELRGEFETMFPAWAGVETEKSWFGFVALSRTLTPFAGPIPDMKNAWACLCYHGNGVAMGSWAGTAMADCIAGRDGATEAVPMVMRGEMRRFPMARIRLAFLRAAYLGYKLRDDWT